MSYVPVHNCPGCGTTGGVHACPHHGPQADPPGVTTMTYLQTGCTGTYGHEWLPWCDVGDGWATKCIHCQRVERIER